MIEFQPAFPGADLGIELPSEALMTLTESPADINMAEFLRSSVN